MISNNISLKIYNTYGLDYRTDCFISIKSENELLQALNTLSGVEKPILVLGGGSNLLFTEDFKGTVINPDIGGIYIEENNRGHSIVSCGAGVHWDKLVEWSVEKGLGGLENLSYIPGTAGAAPLQNIGAYGVEVKDSVEKVRAVSISDGSIREFSNEECLFGYRDSIFKNKLKGKYAITKVFFRLQPHPVLATGYGSLREEMEKLGPPSLQTVRNAVINIRKAKLPDPEVIGNAGSFFKNPVVSLEKIEKLRQDFPGIPFYPDQSGGIKLAAGWLIEKCGWKGKRSGDAGVYEKQALVLVNYGGATGKEIYDLSEKIRLSVFVKFGVELVKEVEIIGPEG